MGFLHLEVDTSSPIKYYAQGITTDLSSTNSFIEYTTKRLNGVIGPNALYVFFTPAHSSEPTIQRYFQCSFDSLPSIINEFKKLELISKL